MAQSIEYQYKIRKEILINQIQKDTFETMEKYGVNVSQFIRQAIKEKINREWKEIKEEHENKYKFKAPF